MLAAEFFVTRQVKHPSIPAEVDGRKAAIDSVFGAQYGLQDNWHSINDKFLNGLSDNARR